MHMCVCARAANDEIQSNARPHVVPVEYVDEQIHVRRQISSTILELQMLQQRQRTEGSTSALLLQALHDHLNVWRNGLTMTINNGRHRKQCSQWYERVKVHEQRTVELTLHKPAARTAILIGTENVGNVNMSENEM